MIITLYSFLIGVCMCFLGWLSYVIRFKPLIDKFKNYVRKH